MEQRNDHDALKDAPILRSIQAQDPFRVPDGFFDRFPTDVQARIAERKGRSFSSGWMAVPGWLRISSALGAIALIVGAFLLFRSTPTDQEMAAVPAIDLTTDDLLLDRYEMSELVHSIEQPDGLMAAIGQDLDRDDLALYLENEELPLDLLIEEL